MNDQLQTLKNELSAAQSVLLAFPENSNQDIVAAALALYLSLKEAGKVVSVSSSTAQLVRDSRLVGLDKITSDVGGTNLVITLDVPENAIDKVVSNTEGGHLNLVINPAKGTSPITPENVKFGYSGAVADLVIVVGAADLSDLGALLEKEPGLFAKERLVNLSNQVGSFAKINLTDPSASNSELVTALLKELGLPMDIDIAGNLMRGIESATDGLSSLNLTADTFEALAVLYRIGARRTPQATPSQPAKIVSDLPIVDSEVPQEDWKGPKIYTSSHPIQ